MARRNNALWIKCKKKKKKSSFIFQIDFVPPPLKKNFWGRPWTTESSAELDCSTRYERTGIIQTTTSLSYVIYALHFRPRCSEYGFPNVLWFRNISLSLFYRRVSGHLLSYRRQSAYKSLAVECHKLHLKFIYTYIRAPRVRFATAHGSLVIRSDDDDDVFL
jgi:hypothetical protein